MKKDNIRWRNREKTNLKKQEKLEENRKKCKKRNVRRRQK